MVHEDLTQDYKVLADRHSKVISQLLEEFGGNQFDTSLQLQAYENELRQVVGGKTAGTDSNSREHTIEGPKHLENEILEVTMAPNPPMDAHLDSIDVTTVDTAESPMQETSHEELTQEANAHGK